MNDSLDCEKMFLLLLDLCVLDPQLIHLQLPNVPA